MIYHGDALEYIGETPDILSRIIEGQASVLQDCGKIFDREGIRGEISEVILTGSGSSYNAAVGASVFAQKLLGIRVTPVYPVTVMEEMDVVSDKALVIGISQQGTSTAVIRALDAAGKKGFCTVAVTGEYETEITRHGEAVLYVECGYEDAGATTKGYTATVLTLFLFFIMAAEKTGRITGMQKAEYISRLRRVTGNMPGILEESFGWCKRTADKLVNSRDLMLITGSSMRASLLEGCLKFSETCRFPVRGYEAEEFMHGIYNAVTEDTDFLYLFPADGYEKMRMEKLYGYYREKGYRHYAVNLPETACSEGQCANVLCCHFINDPDFSVLEYMLPQQMLFVLASRARGIDLNLPKDPEFHKYMGSKIE